MIGYFNSSRKEKSIFVHFKVPSIFAELLSIIFTLHIFDINIFVTISVMLDNIWVIIFN